MRSALPESTGSEGEKRGATSTTVEERLRSEEKGKRLRIRSPTRACTDGGSMEVREGAPSGCLRTHV